MNKRKPISKKTRFEIFKRDNFACQYCGGHPPKSILHVDHIHPVSLGGTNEAENLITSCSTCNLGKSATPLTRVPKSLKDTARETEEREMQIAGFAKVMEAARDRIERDVWDIAIVFDPSATEGYSRASFGSIKRFVNELGVFDVKESAELAVNRNLGSSMSEKTFKYFCGICWRKVKDKSE